MMRLGIGMGKKLLNLRVFIPSRQISLKPNFSKYKLIPQPPGNIVGTVNDPYVPPSPSFFEGGYHWTYERAIAIGLIPCSIAPFIVGTDIPMIDYIFSVLLLAHCHTGIKSCIIDYIPQRVYGIWHKIASRVLTLGSCMGLYGIYVLETTSNGIFELIRSLWGA